MHITRELELRGILVASRRKAYAVPTSGQDWFASLGVQVPSWEARPEKLARRCLDWTERRHHLAGTLGVALFKRLHELHWIAPIPGSRAIRVTIEGKRRLWELLRLPIG